MKKNKIEWIILYADIDNNNTLKFYEKNNYQKGKGMIEFVKEF